MRSKWCLRKMDCLLVELSCLGLRLDPVISDFVESWEEGCSFDSRNKECRIYGLQVHPQDKGQAKKPNSAIRWDQLQVKVNSVKGRL